MSAKICFTFHGRKICIPIYYEIPRFRIPHDPGPLHELIDPGILREITALGHIADVAAELSPAHRQEFTALAQKVAQNIQLPKELSLTIGHERQLENS